FRSVSGRRVRLPFRGSFPIVSVSDPGEPMSLLDVAGLSFAYPSREPAVKEVSFTVAAGEHLGIVGPNGAGKSTLLRLLGGLLRPGVGTIRYDGKTLSEWPRLALARRHSES